LTLSVQHQLTPLEVSCGLVFGHEPDAAEPEDPAEGRDGPVEALERAILPALLRPPCLISFSGGRDSAAVLAVAARLARREQLPLPIPATNRFPDVSASDESLWQEQIVAHVRVEDWIKLDFTDELDAVGPIAGRALRRHGLLWPFNAHFHVPLLEAAQGASLLTGIGGDEALSASRWTRASAVMSGQVLPVPRDLVRVAFALSPRPLRSRVLRRRMPAGYPWLREHARREVSAAWAAEAAAEPIRWRARFRWCEGLRYLKVGISSLAVLAADADVRIVHPLADARFGAALARLPRRRRFSNRAEAMRLLFSDVLPEQILVRTTKASFDRAFFNRHSEGLVKNWRGEAIDCELVNGRELRGVWTSPEPDARSFSLLQSVWLAYAGRQSSEAVSVGNGLEQALSSRNE
jgi:hypothetical protein